MRRFILLAAACVSEHQLEPVPPEPERTGWIEPNKGSAVGGRFLVEFPEWQVPGEHHLWVWSEVPTTLTIAGPSFEGGGGEIERTIPSGWTDVVVPPEPEEENRADDEERVAGSAVLVTADDPVEIVAGWVPDYTEGADQAATRLLPVEELGTEYHFVLWGDASPEPFARDDNGYFFDVVAAEDGTEVVASPSDVPFVLDAGDRARIAQPTLAVAADTTWSVTASRPVAVFAAGVANCFIADVALVWEQLPPVSRWGTDYVVTPFDGQDASEVVLVTDEDTAARVDCGPAFPLLAGRATRLTFSAPARITSARPISAQMVSRRYNCGDERFGAAMVALTPSALSRGSLPVEPWQFEYDKGDDFLLELGATATTVATIAADDASFAASPHLTVGEVQHAPRAVVQNLLVDRESTVSGGRFRGVLYLAAPFFSRTGLPDGYAGGQNYEQLPGWTDLLRATHLGYDCLDCVQHLADLDRCPDAILPFGP